jgi:hypothetical protein
MEDPEYSVLQTPSMANALFSISPDRMNQQRTLFEDPTSPTMRQSLGDRHSRDSSVHEKTARYESIASSQRPEFQGKLLERKTNDKALERAMMGREQAEGEMRRWREEAMRARDEKLALGRDNERLRADKRKVSERLESVMVCLS